MAEDMVFYGRDQGILEIPQATWKQRLNQVPQHGKQRLSFMTDEHHRVRNFVVKEIFKQQKPVAPQTISRMLDMPFEQVKLILDELERHLFFLVRDARGAVSWAYPMTVDVTPHRMNFRTGEQLYGA